ncbi:MAG: hypothetical protein Q8908_05230 [Bacteroidota bacterium]|nr:hypothetical protein [Bacteroidota bacterium]
MKNSFIILSVLIPFIFIGCKKNPPSVTITTMVDIAYKDKSGKDLLNPSTENCFSVNNIHIYHLVNGIKEEVFRPQMTYPHDFFIYKNNELNQYFIRVFLLSDPVLVELNPTITDTLSFTADKYGASQILRKVWYNGELKWEFPVEQKFTIIK